ncbi:hypothetical protein CVV38_02885 [Candidatus Peregrinibacteria bacterium HGW-Peregrinibacteria-1]|jgi:hypothetical protein|nr:MAG: hypothetical protein CVV38_02885 [Candidatus Peregrinibacteria bacterium HGW-Peregrinibacteria-1]
MEKLLIAIGVGLVAFFAVKRLLKYLRGQANASRAMSMVFLDVRVPKKESKEDRETDGEQYDNRGFKEAACGVMKQFFESLHSIYNREFSRHFVGQDFLSFEYVVLDGQVHFLIVCPRQLVALVEKQLTGFYPDVHIEEMVDYNLFKPNSKVVATHIVMKKENWLPIKTYEQMTADPINTIVNSLSKVDGDERAAIQLMVRPRENGWQEKGRKEANRIFQNKKSSGMSWYNPISWLGKFFELMVKGESVSSDSASAPEKTTPLTDEEVKAIETKNSKVGFDVVMRLVSVANDRPAAMTNLNAMKSAFAQYGLSNGNSLDYTNWDNTRNLVKNFIFRNFNSGSRRFMKHKPMLLSSEELASIFHVPNIRFNKYPSIAWQNYKTSPPPKNIPKDGILLGHNLYRGQETEIRIKREDRFRHFYVIGQTGTGKSSILQVMIRQDLKNGDGLCVIDPHGSLIEDILPFIPRERADDVVYFNPADMDRPLGLNLLEGGTWEEKELVALDAMNIMIKLFDEEIFGPRIQDYFRNGCLTLMSDPEGGALTDIVRLFTDDEFAMLKRKHVTNPIVASFWDNQMAKTGAREKQEMIPYFAAKFGQFVTNTMMRNIIGQAKSAFDFAEVMNNKKILLMNLSKGDVGEINSKLLGLIIVQKIQMAALKRQKVAKEDRQDFFLYIDEFQNYVTDSIEVILSEARKYRLGLNVAHQYLAQIDGEGKKGGVNLKDAVFGNVGTMMSYKIGAQDAEDMAREMAPVFSDQDLINIDKYKAVMKLSIDTQPSRPFSITPLNPYLDKGDKEAAEAYIQLSRLKYGKDREFVEREILRRVGAI